MLYNDTYCNSARHVVLCIVKYSFIVVSFRFVAMVRVTSANRPYMFVINALDLGWIHIFPGCLEFVKQGEQVMRVFRLCVAHLLVSVF